VATNHSRLGGSPPRRLSNKSGPSPAELRKLGIVRVGDVEPRNVTWLWDRRVPMRTVTLLAGIGGQGKSQITDWLAAELSTGRMTGEPESTLIMSAEDPIAEVLNPRLQATQADLNRVYTLRVGEDLVLPNDLENGNLAHIIEQLGVRVLVLDPIVAYVDVKTDTHKTQDVRRMLKMLAAVAEKQNIAVVVVMHFKKGEASSNIIHQVSGAAGFGDAVRSALMVSRDPRWDGPDADAPFVMLHIKNSYGKMRPPLAYHIEGHSFMHRPGIKIDTSRIVWDGSDVTLRADDVFGENRDAPDRRQAEKFLRTYLADGRQPVKQVKDAAAAEMITAKTLRNAKEKLGVISSSTHTGDKSKFQEWFWALPQSPDALPDARQLDTD